MIDTVLAIIGCVTGVMGFLAGSAALIWAIGSARSTHRIEYQPFPTDPLDLFPRETGPSSEDADVLPADAEPEMILEPKAEREAAKKTQIITSFSQIYPDLDE